MSKNNDNGKPIALLAMLLAWLVPGMGHIYLGRVKRGVVILVTVTALFWGGMAMGGVLTMDYYYERWWFIAEMFTGVNGVVGWYNQHRVYDKLSLEPAMGERIRAEATGQVGVQRIRVDKHLAEENIALVAPTDVVARAYAGVAGLLNLMCIFDAMVLGLMGCRGERYVDEESAKRQATGEPQESSA